MTIYLDIILLENLCMNYIILFATGLVHKVKIKQWRILFSSLIGGIYSILSFAKVLEIYSNIIFKFILSVVMIYIAFKPKNLKILVKELLIFYLVSFAFGGCAFCLLYFVKPQDILMRNGVLTGSYPIKIALLGGIVGFVIVNIAFKIVKGRYRSKDMFCKVNIFWKDKNVELKALIDTGNMLKDPLSNTPVIVVEKQILEQIIPKQILDSFMQMVEGKISNFDEFSKKEEIPNFRMIPFTSLGKQNRIIISICT